MMIEIVEVTIVVMAVVVEIGYNMMMNSEVFVIVVAVVVVDRKNRIEVGNEMALVGYNKMDFVAMIDVVIVGYNKTEKFVVGLERARMNCNRKKSLDVGVVADFENNRMMKNVRIVMVDERRMYSMEMTNNCLEVEIVVLRMEMNYHNKRRVVVGIEIEIEIEIGIGIGIDTVMMTGYSTILTLEIDFVGYSN